MCNYRLISGIELYQEYLKPPKVDEHNKVRRKLQDYNFLLSMFRNDNFRGYLQMKVDKEKMAQVFTIVVTFRGEKDFRQKLRQ